MLRWSSETNQAPLDIRGITDPTVNPLVEGGRDLIRFVDATLSGKPDLATARAEVTDRLGQVAAVRAALVIGNFEMMNRVADGVGVPVSRARLSSETELIGTLGLDRIAH